ncbi:hypothetical protein [Gordonia sp. 'Campus']|uniref:hypothetical protein n=1 Tax=Gordonia sp. 'Campus' TaxID=2915824 RepID=UPI001EE3D6FA|nr:hypothetical protein [Gordonia sp. 'Campus']
MTDPNNPGDQQPNYGQQPFQGQPGQPYPGQYPGYPPAQPPKKRKKWPWVLLALVVVFLVFAGGCVALIGGAAESIEEESERVVNVTYEITGDGPTGSAIYTNGDLNTSTDNDIPIPWKKDVEITGFVKVVSLTASNSFDSTGTIKCIIRQGDKVLSEGTASGPGASANCSGNAE